MSIAGQLERNLRARVERNLEQSRTVLVELIRAPLNEVTGQLRGGILVDAWSSLGDRYESRARSLAPYSVYVDKGTGIYGPRGDRIYPTTKKALTFFWAKQGGVVSFRSVRGSPPQNYFEQPMADNYAQALVTVWGP